MKKIYFLCLYSLLLTVSVGSWAQKGCPWTTPSFPFSTKDSYGWSAGLYLPAQIGGPQTINKLTLYLDNYGGWDVNYDDVQIYLRHTTIQQYTSCSYPGHSTANGWVKVFDGNFDFDNNQLYTYNFNVSSFIYNGTDNLEVLIENHSDTYDDLDGMFARTDYNSGGIFFGKHGEGYNWNSAKSTCTRRPYNLAIRFNNLTKYICEYPLPIELTSSALNCTSDGAIQLIWTSASETNNDFYTIEYSTDGKIWQRIRKVDGAGNSSSSIDYKEVFQRKNVGITYYRLSQTDFNGSSTNLSIFSADCSSTNSLSVYPNPTHDFLNVIVKEDINAKAFSLYNLLGQKQEIHLQLLSKEAGTINISQLPRGIYYLQYRGELEEQPIVKRIVKL